MKELIDQELKRRYLDQYDFEVIFDDRIESIARLFEYEKGDHIIDVDSDLPYLLFLVKGVGKIYTTLENGKTYLLRIESPLSAYGDVEILRGQASTAYVTALKKCHVIAVPSSVIRRDYVTHPPFLQYIIDSLAGRLVKISYKSTEDMLMPLKNKLASFLLAHKDEDSDRISFSPTYQDVADQLGSTYRHLSRTFAELTDEGIIIKKGKKIQVVDLDRLAELAGDTYKY